MKAPPRDLDTNLLGPLLDHHWSIRTTELSYLPVGFGDHHWRAIATAERYFVSVRDLRLDGRTDDHRRTIPLLEQTFQAVRHLRNQADLLFIVPALPTRFGALVVPLGSTFALSVYNWLDLEPAQDEDGIVAAGLVGRLHNTSREVPVPAVVEDFRIPHRAALEASLSDLDRQWGAGPFGEQAREQIAAHKIDIESALKHYDGLVAECVGASRDWCLTHGEPSGANLLQDPTGAYYLVDWESARIAPPERDLVDLWSSRKALDHYRQVTNGPTPNANVLRLYRLWYALAETCVYVLQFRTEHSADGNMVESWQNFLNFLPGRQWSDADSVE